MGKQIWSNLMTGGLWWAKDRIVSHDSCFFHNRAAFFHGQIEQPVRGLMSFFNHRDAPILIGVNERGVFIVDKVNGVSTVNGRFDAKFRYIPSFQCSLF